MERKFKEAFAGLNDRQRQAVETIDGPVLVIAGPGTGKTQLLSARIANILKTTDAGPANILALTFTNKAAVNMRERIVDLIGPAGARVGASTFHSLAAEIMNIYPDHFWNAARLAIAPQSVQLDVIEAIVKSLPLNNPLALKFAGQYTLLKDIQQSINLTKEAGLTPDKLRAIINANVAYINAIEEPLAETCEQRLSAKNLEALRSKIESLPKQEIDQYLYPLVSLSTIITGSLDEAIKNDGETGKTTNTGKWKTRWIQTIAGKRGMFGERQRNAWWLELANVYESYRDVLHQRGFYDYADMLVEVIVQLEQRPIMLADIQERFNYVLIDEFQDTNPAQLRLAHLIADHHSAEGNPNLMAVGDDDQSIFKFNGAELNNMLGFRQAYPAAKVIVLTDNYRSSQAILDTAKRIIEQADKRLVSSEQSLNKDLVAKTQPGKGLIKAVAYSSKELQYSQIAHDIQKRYRPSEEIAVLARGHDSLIKMADLLQQLGVPVRYEQARNILEHEIVSQVYLVIKLLLAIQNGDREIYNSLIHRILRWPAWGVDANSLWRLAVTNYRDKDWLNSLLHSEFDGLKAIGNWFTWLAQEAGNQPLAVTIEQVLGLRQSRDYTSPIKNYFTSSLSSDTNSYFHGLSAIQLLRALVHEFSKAGEPTLDELVRFIEVNRENGIIVADESPFITGSRAVQLLSVHKAKGLEFDHVYIVDMVEDNWRPKAGGRKPPANLPLQPVGDDLDDYIRLMYVASTRAKSSLTISAYYQDHVGKVTAISPIVQSALPIEKIDQKEKRVLITVLEENLHWPDLKGGQEKEILKARLENYNLYVTHLLNFLDLTKGGPQYFKERNLLNLPEAKTASLSYGTAIHTSLDVAQKLTNRGSFSLAKAKKAFSEALEAEQLMPSDHKRYDAQGRRELTRLFNELKYRLPKDSISEQKLKDIMLGKALIGGTLDRVDNQGDKLVIIDYKTGRPLTSFTTNDKKQALKAYKHKLQLVFYALLIGQNSAGIKPPSIEGQMVYVEAQAPKELIRTYMPTVDDIEQLGRLVQAVYQKIVNLDLPNVSAYPKDIDGIRKFEEDLISK